MFGGVPEEAFSDVWDLCTHHLKNGVRAYDIRKESEKYVLMFSFWDMNELFDLSYVDGKMHGAKFIKAACEPFCDEMEIDERKMMAWLDHFGIDYDVDEEDEQFFKRSHVSGHASRPELLELIRSLRPKRLVPIHTEHPEIFEEELKDTDIEVVIPEVGKPIDVH